jgi:hypothetical protein
MRRLNFASIFILASIWIALQSTTCRRPIPYNNCGQYKLDSVYFKMDVTNQAATFTLADSINVYSRISDTVTPVISSGFIYPMQSINALVQVYKVVSSGGSYQLNFANIEFNMNVQIGTIQAYQGLGYNILYNRNQPTNELQFSLKPGVPGLYVVAINKNYYETYIRNPNDDCVSYTNNIAINAAKQNLQYWNTLGGATSLNLANSGGNISINKNDKNYFFVKIIP